MKMNSNVQETRQRLLESAGEIFADRGFHRVTTRDICARAGANVAAINYHFGDKEGLYVEVLKHLVNVAFETYPPDGGLPADAPAEARLRAFIRSFLLRLVGEGAASWHGRLIAREMAEPTPAFSEIVAKAMNSEVENMHRLVREILGPDSSYERVRDATHSIMGQCLFYYHGRPMIERACPELTFSDQDIDHLVDHISQFSLGGLHQCAKGDHS